MPRRLPLLCALLLLFPAVLPAQERELRSPRGREIRSLIEALGADQFQAREAARTRLIEIGPEALPWLERAQDDADPERASAASELVRTLRWLVPADLRGLVRDALDDFPGKSSQRRQALVIQLAGLGAQAAPALPWLVTAARFDADPQVRITAVEVFLHLSSAPSPEHDASLLTALAGEREDDPRVQLLRGQLLRRMGRGADAIAAAQRACELAPAAKPPRQLLIELLVDAGRYDEALPLATEEANATPPDPHAVARLGELLLLAGRTADGLEVLGAVGKLALDALGQGGPAADAMRELVLRLVHAYLRGQRPDEAEQLLRVALGRFPYDHELNVAMGALHALRGRTRQALDTWLSELVLTSPGSGPYQALCERLARLLEANGAPAGLVRDEAFFRDAQRGRPLVQVRLAVAGWLRARGLLADAARELRLAAALSPGEPGPLRLLGEVLAEDGQYAAAREALQAALALAPDDARLKARLLDLQGATGQPDGPREAERCAFWERQIEPGELERAPEAVPGVGAPPLVAGEIVLAAASGTTRVYGLSAADGHTVWTYEARPPSPPEGALPEQMGLEPVGLLAVPSALVAATHPARARVRTPLAALLCNVYWRPAHRSWRKAAFKGVRLHVIDPLDGRELAVSDLPLDAQVVAPLPVSRRGRALLCVSPRQNRLELVLLDLVLCRPVWRSRVPVALTRPPHFAGERVVLAWPAGVLALDGAGKLAWEHTPAPAAEAEDASGTSFSTGPTGDDRAVLVGTTDGRVLRLGPQGEPLELGRPGQARLTGELVQSGPRLFVAERGGAISALTLPAEPAAAAAVDSTAPLVWRVQPGKAAERELAWAGGLLFALNGSGDVFDDETPSVLALDPEDGKVVFQRRVGRPAALVPGDALVAVVSGGRGARAGMQVVAVRPQERFDPLHARLEELKSAAQGALAEGQAEVAAVVARAWVAQLGGLERLDDEGLLFMARALGRSNRPDEALDVVYLGEARATKEQQTSWDALRKELGLAEPEKPPPPGDNQKPGTDKPPEKPPEAPPEKPPGEEPKPPKPMPPKPPQKDD